MVSEKWNLNNVSKHLQNSIFKIHKNLSENQTNVYNKIITKYSEDFFDLYVFIFKNCKIDKSLVRCYCESEHDNLCQFCLKLFAQLKITDCSKIEEIKKLWKK